MITERLRQSASLFAEREACRIGGNALTYAELWQRAVETGDLLRRQGTSPVILRGDHCIDEIVTVTACLLARRAYVSVGSCVPEERFREIVRMTGSTLVVELGGCGADDRGTCEDGKRTGEGCGEETAAGPNGSEAGEFENTRFECLTLEGLERYRGCEPKDSDNNTAYIIFTSGSTGTPKGVPISYDNLENFVRWIGSVSPLSEYRGVNVLNQASLGFDLSVADLYYSLCYGHTWVAMPGGYSDASFGMTEAFCEERINVAVMTPSALKLCLLEETFVSKIIPTLRAIFFCGERLEKKPVRKLFARFPEIAVVNAYGPTEATCAVCAVRITPEMAESDEELPVGEIDTAATGITLADEEIVLAGASVFAGYADGRDGGHFTKDGVNGYRTGDRGYVRDGLLYYSGRSDNQIKYKGYRIELDEIENRINRLPGVRECAVVAKRTPDGIVKTIQAFYVAERGDDGVTPADIKAGLAATLPQYMIPKTVNRVEGLPRNANGKTDRKALGEL